MHDTGELTRRHDIFVTAIQTGAVTWEGDFSGSRTDWEMLPLQATMIALKLIRSKADLIEGANTLYRYY